MLKQLQIKVKLFELMQKFMQKYPETFCYLSRSKK